MRYQQSFVKIKNGLKIIIEAHLMILVYKAGYQIAYHLLPLDSYIFLEFMHA
jgi:hypothetical protein